MFSPRNLAAAAMGLLTGVCAAVWTAVALGHRTVGVSDVINNAAAIGTFLAVVTALVIADREARERRKAVILLQTGALQVLEAEVLFNVQTMHKAHRQVSLFLLANPSPNANAGVVTEFIRTSRSDVDLIRACGPDRRLLERILQYQSALANFVNVSNKAIPYMLNGVSVSRIVYQRALAKDFTRQFRSLRRRCKRRRLTIENHGHAT